MQQQPESGVRAEAGQLRQHPKINVNVGFCRGKKPPMPVTDKQRRQRVDATANEGVEGMDVLGQVARLAA